MSLEMGPSIFRLFLLPKKEWTNYRQNIRGDELSHTKTEGDRRQVVDLSVGVGDSRHAQIKCFYRLENNNMLKEIGLTGNFPTVWALFYLFKIMFSSRSKKKLPPFIYLKANNCLRPFMADKLKGQDTCTNEVFTCKLIFTDHNFRNLNMLWKSW